MKTQRVKILVLVAKDGTYCAAGNGHKGEHEKQLDWLYDSLPNDVFTEDCHEVWVEADVPLPPEPPTVEGEVPTDGKAIGEVVRKRRDAENPGRDGRPGVEMLRTWLRGLHMNLVGGWDQDTSQDRIAELLGEHPRGHEREFKVKP